MSQGEWSWCGAISIGTSHTNAGKACDDFGCCIQRVIADERVLILVASDGAGTAKYGRTGARVTSRLFARSALNTLRSLTLEAVSEEHIACWLDAIRDQIIEIARKLDAKPRDFAATLVGCVIVGDNALIVHVGDGACVVRFANSENWEVASWPQHGEYASTTMFVTDEPSPRFKATFFSNRISQAAAFTDGLERLALDFTGGVAHQPFFRTIFAPLANQAAGRNRRLSTALKNFLDGPTVTERTDDDKTLILAVRVSG